MARKMCIYDLSVPLNGGKAGTIKLDSGTGNMTIDCRACDEALLASGKLEYFENNGLPVQWLSANNGRIDLALSGKGGMDRIRLPWQVCNGATTWQVHLNPAVELEVKALSGGGNLNLDLAGASLAGLEVETGGGNIDAVLPEAAGTLAVSLKSGAGNVSVCLPAGVQARVRATTGWGKVIVDPALIQVEKYVYQSADFDTATNRVEVVAGSGAGNVVISRC